MACESLTILTIHRWSLVGAESRVDQTSCYDCYEAFFLHLHYHHKITISHYVQLAQMGRSRKPED